MNNNTIIQVVKNELCTGCGTCIGACPNDAIKLALNKKKGIYIPDLDEYKCSNCGLCYAICPGHGIDLKELNLEIFGKEPEDWLIGNYFGIYLGHSTDLDIRYNSSSGGLITQVLIFALEEGIINGALVTRMKKDNPLEPEPFIARTKEEIIEASRSKYCPVPANIALKEIMCSNKGEKFAVVGLPCHIQGIRKLEKANKKFKDKIVLHIGIVCNHVPTFFATKFLMRKNGVKYEDLKNIDYRGNGWPGGMQITKKNGDKIFIPQFSVDYWGGPLSSFFFPARCLLCNDKICELSDASFADAWIPELMRNDSIGTSLVVSRDEKSEYLLTKMVSNNLIEIKISDKTLPYQSQGLYQVKKRLGARINVFKLFMKKIPEYDQDLPSSSAIDYIYELQFYIFNQFFSRGPPWAFIGLYRFLLRKGAYFKSKLVKTIMILRQESCPKDEKLGES